MQKLFTFIFGLFFSMDVFAAYGLEPVPQDLLKDSSGVLNVPNMPKVRTQDTLGICYSFVAATLLNEANCVAKKTPDCSKVPDTELISPLDAARFSAKLDEDADQSDRFNYEGLSEGGSGALTVYNALRAQAMVKESCAPFDQVVSKAKDPVEAQKLELSMWKKFKDSYESYKKKSKECANCGLEYATAKSEELRENFNLKATNQDVLDAFAQETYAKFLDKLLVPDHCWDFKNQLSVKGSWSVKQFPEGGKKSDYNNTITKIKEVLGKKRPMSLGFCAQNPKVTVKSVKACGEIRDAAGNVAGAGHEVVIKGYRKVCKSDGSCYEALQVQNSWGESWQNSNSDGWVDARVLLDRSFYESGALTWLDPQQ